MRIKNGESGYGIVTKILHWLTVIILGAQLSVAALMDAEAPAERAEEVWDNAEDQAKDAGDEKGEAAAEVEYLVGLGDGLDLIDVHVALGLSLILVVIVRLGWRKIGGLPPWAPALSKGERALAHWTEPILLVAILLLATSGSILLIFQDDDWLWLHLLSLGIFCTALALHLYLVVRHTFVKRNRLLHRMTVG